jgi:hypothetical protein
VVAGRAFQIGYQGDVFNVVGVTRKHEEVSGKFTFFFH